MKSQLRQMGTWRALDRRKLELCLMLQHSYLVAILTDYSKLKHAASYSYFELIILGKQVG